jgi:flagellin
MPQVINTNIASLNSQRALNSSQGALNTALQRLSTGLRVNSAKDDAAGIAVGARMDTQVRGMSVAMRNAGDATSLVQTADGALSTVTDVLQRMRELAVQAANPVYGAGELGNLNTEYQQLSSEITRIATTTKFNNQAVLDADAGAFAFQVGANASETLSVTTVAVTTVAGDLTSTANANTAIGAIDTKLDSINTNRATYGAAMSRLDFAVQNLGTSRENQAAAKSRIMDADFAAETASLTRAQILQQSGVAMLAQANAVPNNVLQLLRG